MEEVTAKIYVIEAILACPRKYPDKTADERLDELKKDFPGNNSLFTYFDFSKERLQNLLEELQREKNLLQEKELKQIGSTTGNYYLV